jgi:hypothetical protein
VQKNAFLRAELHLKFYDQFSQNGSCRVSKCPSFCVDLKNVNIPLCQNAPKKVIPVKLFLYQKKALKFP